MKSLQLQIVLSHHMRLLDSAQLSSFDFFVTGHFQLFPPFRIFSIYIVFFQYVRRAGVRTENSVGQRE